MTDSKQDYDELPLSEVAEIADLVRKAESIKAVEGIPVAILDGDQRVHDFEHFLASPRAITEAVKVVNVDSLVAYCNRYANADSVIFVDDARNTITAVFDYHGIGGNPEWCRHKAMLSLVRTPEWEKWRHNSGKRLGQVEFAEFIQDNMMDVVQPNGARLLEIVTNLSSHRQAKFASNVRLDNGQVQFTYEEEIRGTATGGQVSIPEEFSLGIRPFVRCPLYSIGARLRYRVTEERKLAIWYELIRPERIETDAFETVVEGLTMYGKLSNDMPVFYGTR